MNKLYVLYFCNDHDEKHNIDDYQIHFIYDKFEQLNCHSVSF